MSNDIGCACVDSAIDLNPKGMEKINVQFPVFPVFIRCLLIWGGGMGRGLILMLDYIRGLETACKL